MPNRSRKPTPLRAFNRPNLTDSGMTSGLAQRRRRGTSTWFWLWRTSGGSGTRLDSDYRPCFYTRPRAGVGWRSFIDTWPDEMIASTVGCRTFPSQRSDAPPRRCQRATNSVEADAALPFLSGAAGLMLVVALMRLQHGELMQQEAHDWRIDFLSARRIATRGTRRCSEGMRGLGFGRCPSLGRGREVGSPRSIERRMICVRVLSCQHGRLRGSF